MTVDVVIARYCEDLAWAEALPADWRRVVYDKSQGGPRDRVVLPRYASPDGPDAAPLWPGAIALPNVGGEGHTYCHHLADAYERLADRTLFVQGNPLEHVPQLVARATAAMSVDRPFIPFGPALTCWADGRPGHPEGLPELARMARVFSLALPPRIRWHPWALFMATRRRLQQIPRATWAAARDACQTKLADCAMERLWALVLA